MPPALPWDGNLSPLRLGFIGGGWERKGGPVLLDVGDDAPEMGHSVEVIVIGPPASIRFPPIRRSAPMGFIDKSRDLPRFVELVRSFHFGCLLSRRDEPFGISTLECLRLGVPVIGTTVDGIPETVPAGAGLIVPVEHTGEEIAETLDALLRAPEDYSRMRAAAQERREPPELGP